ncbi:hypothetical protein [Photobacterium toruni]|uniref:Uncharacterized protein n=1 Tax=Photobacterium toruni TaxID=1935446 RepID=A0ABU6LAX1_9GAMM|nr:hypothetical protein [Photobacterium toruni]MEC6814034.1 hypothetical protein [Photobacterium toruni]MEC6832438.1 hypothetical protein [Photobacterium toruni]
MYDTGLIEFDEYWCRIILCIAVINTLFITVIYFLINKNKVIVVGACWGCGVGHVKYVIRAIKKGSIAKYQIINYDCIVNSDDYALYVIF